MGVAESGDDVGERRRDEYSGAHKARCYFIGPMV